VPRSAGPRHAARAGRFAGLAWCLGTACAVCPAVATADEAAATAAPAPTSEQPMLLAAQYTFIEQWQTPLESPYQGIRSLHPDGDRQGTHTIGFYGGWAPRPWGQLYLDTEKFMGAGVSGGTGIGSVTDGDVIHAGEPGLKKDFYIARLYARFMLPLSGELAPVSRGQDQIPGTEASRRLEIKVGRLSVTDDFDRNTFANAARTQFLSTALWNDTAWDFAANTRGYTDGVVVGYVSPDWSLKYGMYRMPLYANGQTLETLLRARGQNLELTLGPAAPGTIVRLLAYRNTARMGDYSEALAIAAATGARPDVAATDQQGRHKTGYAVNAEQPLADDGNTALFVRLGWQDGQTEDFAFTEDDRVASGGAQLSGIHWARAEDRLGVGLVLEGLSDVHRDYLAAGGSGFLLGDGRLDYAHEEILETYYRAQWSWAPGGVALRAQLTPDFQYVRNPGFNQDRGPVRFYALRVHLEF
jgi:high affinity Mn2+ porin